MLPLKYCLWEHGRHQFVLLISYCLITSWVSEGKLTSCVMSWTWCRKMMAFVSCWVQLLSLSLNSICMEGDQQLRVRLRSASPGAEHYFREWNPDVRDQGLSDLYSQRGISLFAIHFVQLAIPLSQLCFSVSLPALLVRLLLGSLC